MKKEIKNEDGYNYFVWYFPLYNHVVAQLADRPIDESIDGNIIEIECIDDFNDEFSIRNRIDAANNDQGVYYDCAEKAESDVRLFIKTIKKIFKR